MNTFQKKEEEFRDLKDYLLEISNLYSRQTSKKTISDIDFIERVFNLEKTNQR